MTTETTPDMTGNESGAGPKDFIRVKIEEDNASGKYGKRVHTRFPPEPNGYLHIGHAKSICLNFGVAREYGGTCNLRFDDTNPVKEDVEYVESIKNDVRWLGFSWEGHELYASDYFGKLYEFAETLIRNGKAFVDSQSAEEIHATRGTLTEPGKNSPYRDRSEAENLDLFNRMKAGEFPDGAHVLRAKIDMASPNVMMRDPVLYRIRHAHHHRTGDTWCIYPMYDFAHCLSDSIEGITHSLCTLEFENNRELYNWLLAAVGVPTPRPEQTEFARLNVTHMVLSKRKLIQLVREGHVAGWDDPRMPTLSGLRRKGYPPEAIRDFCNRVGVARAAGTVVEYSLLEFCVRERLNAICSRVMAVLDPVKIVIENYPEDRVEWFDMPYFPKEGGGTPEGHAGPESRKVPFGRELYIEREDFLEDAPKKFFRLAPGKEVRLRYAYYVTCTGVVKNAAGEITEIRCTYDPATKGGDSPDGRKVKGTLHWVAASHALPVETRLYEHLFGASEADIPEGGTFLDGINPDSLRVVTAMAEPAVADVKAGDRVQFERLGYFRADEDSAPGKPVFNRTATLKDSWAKEAKKE
ncbi:glutamyl-tRNA synthetase [uncultured delta proteobacterium]|uniref:Glutamine--tRNA ligase n=1 Tax=uncultured delta proteobacterium TaxID=34034 RepID=A0A212KF12_9DELT|nr:glutamyl-tRNA synthetase [uncultured delta proteobacterium]